MKHHLASLHHTIPTALSGIGQVLRQPRYAASALVGALGFAWLIFLLTNGGFYGALLMSRLPLIDKLGVNATRDIAHAYYLHCPAQQAQPANHAAARPQRYCLCRGGNWPRLRTLWYITHSPHRGSIFLGSGRRFGRDGCQHHCAWHCPWAQPLFALSIGPDCRHFHNISSAGGASCSHNKQGLA